MDIDLNLTWTLDMDFGLGLARTWTLIVTIIFNNNIQNVIIQGVVFVETSGKVLILMKLVECKIIQTLVSLYTIFYLDMQQEP